MFDKFAEELKTAREQNGLTIQQVAAKSRIDIKFLEAMEIGDFSFLPEIYVKAFVKDYSNIVGLDADLMLKKFAAARQGKVFSEESEEVINKDTESPNKKNNAAPISPKTNPKIEKPIPQAAPASTSFDSVIENNQSDKKSDDSSRKNLLLGTFVAAIFILAFLVYLIFFKPSNEIIVNDKPAEEVISDSDKNQQRYVEEVPPETTFNNDTSATGNNNIISSTDSLLLSIKTVDTSWVKIVIDGRLDEEFIMFPNSQKRIKAGTNYRIAFGTS